MKIEAEVIERLTRAFTFTWRATLWGYVTEDVRQALVESYCMEWLRGASQTTQEMGAIGPVFTCKEIVSFCDILKLSIDERMSRP